MNRLLSPTNWQVEPSPFLLRGIDLQTVDQQEGMECGQSYALIPLNEKLPFGYGVRQRRSLEAEVGVLIVGAACWPRQRRLQRGEVTELVAGLGIGTPEDFGV